MILLLDIGNTHTHLGLAGNRRIFTQVDIPTREWLGHGAARKLIRFAKGHQVDGAALCSVVPRATPVVVRFLKAQWNLDCLVLAPGTLRGLGINYPKPGTIGPDRLANALAARHHFGAPVVVVDFGTAVTFDVVDARGDYIGGIIAPGLSAMTDCLHEKTALLPRIRVRQVRGVVGKSTEQAMLIGAVHGYRGLVRELLSKLKRELGTSALPVVATGGCAQLIASGLPEITTVDPLLTLEGLRLSWERRAPPEATGSLYPGRASKANLR